MHHPHRCDRRRFLRQLGALGAAVAVGGQLPLAARAMAGGNYANLTDYKSLVCVRLEGGMDTHNAFVPYDAPAYSRYAGVRQGLAIGHADLLPAAGNAIAFHPALAGLRQLYNERKLALVTNLGNLFEPLTPADLFAYYASGASEVQIPGELFSHSHQSELAQINRIREPGTSVPGWGGQFADRLALTNANPALPSSYTVAGTNAWQAGLATRPFSVRAGQAIPRFEDFNGDVWPPSEAARTVAWQNMLSAIYSHPLEAQAARLIQETKDRSDTLRGALAAANAIATPYDADNSLARQLRTVAELISIRQDIGAHRQVFFVELGGWDTHGSHLQIHGDLLRTLNAGLVSFQRTLEELGVDDSVTTFTFSEFNRTLTINGDGTDHAWAGEHIVLGGAVDGGNVHGTPIAYDIGNPGEHDGASLFGPADVGSGRFIPEYSIDQYGATLGRWMGLAESDLLDIFPNLGNFTSHDLGFMRDA